MSEKQALREHCFLLLKRQILSNESAMAEVKAAIHNETKSSAGDKFETARATMQQEVDRLKGSIIKLKQQEQLLKQTPSTSCEAVCPGALVLTDRGQYFISIALGKLQVAGNKYYAISPQAPIYQSMRDKKVNDNFTFNSKQIQIISIQ
jgi:hypothetical protein